MSWPALNDRLRLALEWLKLVKMNPTFRFRRHHRPPAPRRSPGSQTHRKTIFAEVVGVRTFFFVVGSLVAERADLVEAPLPGRDRRQSGARRTSCAPKLSAFTSSPVLSATLRRPNAPALCTVCLGNSGRRSAYASPPQSRSGR